MSTYEHAVRTLEKELAGVEQAFGILTEEQWGQPTLLRPLDSALPPWTLLELAGHFDISMRLTTTLLAEPRSGQPGRDRTSFFIFPRAEVAPLVYDDAYKTADGKTPAQMVNVLHETFGRCVEGGRAAAPETIGTVYNALMRIDEFVPSRVVEAVVHGIDLTDALGAPSIATPDGIAVTAAILDDLLARRTVPGRPGDLADNFAWIRAASGRAPHPDPRLPLIG